MTTETNPMISRDKPLRKLVYTEAATISNNTMSSQFIIRAR